MTSDKTNTEGLEDFFEAARERPPEPSAEMMARVLADAEALQPNGPARRHMPSVWRQLMDGLGGWPSMAGLATAALAGVWIGINPPSVIEPWSVAMLGAEDQAGFWIDTSAELALGFSVEEF